MFPYQSLKITSFDPGKYFLHSDNVDTYFTVSNISNASDGLYYKSKQIISSIRPSFGKTRMIYKQLSPIWINACYTSNEMIRFILLKNGDGFLIVIKNRKFLLKNRKYPLAIKMGKGCEILEKNSNKVIFKFSNKINESEIYFGISSMENNYLENINIDESLLTFQIKPDLKSDDIILYTYYDSNYDDLIREMNVNSSNIESMKKMHLKNAMLPFKYSKFNTENRNFNKALSLAELSASSFIMKCEEHIGIWAGFPYFLENWGRDTFISLGGICYTSGRFEEAVYILEKFAAHQCKDKKSDDYGKIPNFVSKSGISYNSSDSTPLFIRAVYQYFLYTGNIEALLTLWDTVKLAVDSRYFALKKDNDMVLQNDGEDWMDAKKDGIHSYSPRGGFAVEIQSLWYTALYSISMMINDILNNKYLFPDNICQNDLKKYRDKCLEGALNIKKSFNKLFISKDSGLIADHINEDGTADTTVRPNAILAIHYSSITNIPSLIDNETALKYFKKIIPELIYKHGVSSLGRNESWFHPYHINDNYHKDAAYHNGVIWNWLYGSFASISCKFGMHDFAFNMTEELVRQLNISGTLSELSDTALNEKGDVNSSGTYSQAWSVAEYDRVFYENFLGINPDVPGRVLYLNPSIPLELGSAKASVRYGMHESVFINAKTDRNLRNLSYLEIKGLKINKPLILVVKIKTGIENSNEKHIADYQYLKAVIKGDGDGIRMTFNKKDFNTTRLKELSLSGNAELMMSRTGFKTYNENPYDGLHYASQITSSEAASFSSIREKDFLEKKLLDMINK